MRRNELREKLNNLSGTLDSMDKRIARIEKVRDADFVQGWYVMYDELPTEENGGISAVGYFMDAGEYYRIRSRWTYSISLLDGGIVSKLFARGKR